MSNTETVEGKCRVCGCTWYNPCKNGCYWVEENLCSKCSDCSMEGELGIKKLIRELEGNKDEKRIPIEPIVKFLISKCQESKEFADRVLIEEKNLKECFDYIYLEVRKSLNGNSGYLDDDKVYRMSQMYFILEDIEKKED